MCLGEKEDRDWEVDPCVSKMHEELWTKLVKFYAGRVKVPSRCTMIPFRDTVTITALAQDQGKMEKLKTGFHQLGLSLHTEDEDLCGGKNNCIV